MGDPERDREAVTVRDRTAGASPHVESAFDPPADRFETVGELGRGGMGRVVEARDRGLGRNVALKQIMSADPVDRARFEREARITARLEHPGIVPIHDAGRDRDGNPYYVMRRVDGRPLEDLVAGKPLAERLALVPNLLAACDATAYAHARGVVHRDIKPTNLLIGPFGETLIIDWGLAREIGDADDLAASGGGALTRAGAVAGTPGFMAPEQARGESVDARSDVFALGATLFYVLAGQPPYTASRATEMIAAVGTDHPPDWSAVPLEVPADLRAIAAKAMATSPTERYRDASAMAADLRRFVTGNLVAAHRYGRIEQLRRFARRHRAAVAVAAVSVAVLAAGAIVSVRRIVAERDDARDARGLAEQKEREAAGTADRLLLARARELVDRDPDAAIALLRQLPDASAQWAQAATVAQAAAIRGVAFGFVAAPSRGIRFELADDGHHAFVGPLLEGPLMVFDLATRSRRELPAQRGLIAMRWLDHGRRIASASRDGTISVVDIETGEVEHRAMPRLHTLETDHAGKIFVVTADSRLLELDDMTTDPIELATDVADVEADRDYTTVAIRHTSGDLEIRTPEGRWTVSGTGHKLHPLAAMRGRVAVYEDKAIVVRGSDGGKLVELGRGEVELAVTIKFFDGWPLVATPTKLVRIDGHGATVLELAQQSQLVTTARGFVTVRGDGTIHVVDRDGTATIGTRPVTIQRVAMGDDGRFVTVVTSTGELLAWDLAAIRPRRYELSPIEQVSAIADDAMWVRGEEIKRLDRATGEKTVVVRAARDHFIAGLWVPRDASLLVAEVWEPGPDRKVRTVTELYDASGRRFGRLPSNITGRAWADGKLVAGDTTGRIAELVDPATFEMRELAKLDGEVSIVAKNGPFIAATIGNEMFRIDLRTHATDRVRLADIAELAIEPDGVVEARVGGKVWLWSGGALSPLQTPSAVVGLEASRLGRVLRGRGNVVVLDPVSHVPRVIASPVDALVTADDSVWAATRGANGMAGVLDLRSGIGFDLTGSNTTEEGLFVTPRSVVLGDVGRGFGEGRTAYEWRLDVPSEPAALRVWLANVTNAKPVAGSETVVWP